MKKLIKLNQIFLWCLFRLYLIISNSDYKSYLTKKDINKDLGYIIAGNHQSQLDPFVIGAAIPFAIHQKFSPIWFIAYRELFSKWYLRFFLRRFGAFPTKEIRDIPYGLEFSISVLKDHGTVCIFPEGKRTNGAIEDPKRGVSIMAEVPSVELIPVLLKWRSGVIIKKVSIKIGAPINASGLSPKQIMDRIYSL